MKIQQFLQEIPELLRSQLPPELQGFASLGPAGSLIKFHIGDRRIHYEVWVQRRARLVEVGLHFEADRAANLAWLEALAPRLPEASDLLGPEVEAQHWTESWTRIHQEAPLAELDEDSLLEVTHRLARLMCALQPLVEAVNPSAGSGQRPMVEQEAPRSETAT
jgi:mRNA-degrading endonuclease RelE of RelBE toxin-antitoxin system